MPTNDSQKAKRAIELFNRSEHPRTIAGVARSLGAPVVVVEHPHSGSTVEIVVAWELCWYRFSVDMEVDTQAVRLVAKGDELGELENPLTSPNALADERGELALAAGDG